MQGTKTIRLWSLQIFASEIEVMPDWIDRLKQQEQDARARREGEQEIKLRTNRMIDAKLPEFWHSIVEVTEAEAKRLQEAFPDNARYATNFERNAEGFTLLQSFANHRELVASLDRNAQRVKISVTDTRTNAGPIRHELIARLTESDEVYLKHNNEERMFTQAKEAAEWFVRKVCGITDHT
jgi:hypothetical protein